MKYIISLMLLACCSVALADNLAKDKSRLENMQIELQQKKEALDKQKEAVKAMEKKLECNYNLLQSYNQCEEKNKKDSEEYKKCMQKAKAASPDCNSHA